MVFFLLLSKRGNQYVCAFWYVILFRSKGLGFVVSSSGQSGNLCWIWHLMNYVSLFQHIIRVWRLLEKILLIKLNIIIYFDFKRLLNDLLHFKFWYDLMFSEMSDFVLTFTSTRKLIRNAQKRWLPKKKNRNIHTHTHSLLAKRSVYKYTDVGCHEPANRKFTPHLVY